MGSSSSDTTVLTCYRADTDQVRALFPATGATCRSGTMRRSKTRSKQPMALVPVILSGGAGTRLWPLSRETAPKPFLTLPDGETLLSKTAARAVALPDIAGLLVITNRDYYFQTKDQFSAAVEK